MTKTAHLMSTAKLKNVYPDLYDHINENITNNSWYFHNAYSWKLKKCRVIYIVNEHRKKIEAKFIVDADKNWLDIEKLEIEHLNVDCVTNYV